MWCNVVYALPKCGGSDSKYWTNCFGTETYNEGTYEGKYKNGKPDGQGTFTWISGTKYVGEWKNGKMHGQGTKTWPDGVKYVGEWKNDEMDGQGILTYSDGNILKGTFKNGEFVN